MKIHQMFRFVAHQICYLEPITICPRQGPSFSKWPVCEHTAARAFSYQNPLKWKTLNYFNEICCFRALIKYASSSPPQKTWNIMFSLPFSFYIDGLIVLCNTLLSRCWVRALSLSVALLSLFQIPLLESTLDPLFSFPPSAVPHISSQAAKK